MEIKRLHTSPYGISKSDGCSLKEAEDKCIFTRAIKRVNSRLVVERKLGNVIFTKKLIKYLQKKM